MAVECPERAKFENEIVVLVEHPAQLLVRAFESLPAGGAIGQNPPRLANEPFVRVAMQFHQLERDRACRDRRRLERPIRRR